MLYHHKKHRKSKKHLDIVQHFQTRCLERLGKVLKQKDLKDCMCRHTLVYVGRQSCNKTHWEIPKELLKICGIDLKDGIDVVVVYDKLRNGFVTVLTYIHNDGFQQKVEGLREWSGDDEEIENLTFSCKNSV